MPIEIVPVHRARAGCILALAVLLAKDLQQLSVFPPRRSRILRRECRASPDRLR